MARTDAMVLGAGIVGTSIALHLVKRGTSVALIDRAGVGEQTSYGNAGVIEGNTVFPPAFPSDFAPLLRVALKRARRSQLSSVVPAAGRALAARLSRRLAAEQSRRDRATDPPALCARCSPSMRRCWPTPARSHYLRKNGWLKVYRSEKSYQALARELDMAASLACRCNGSTPRGGAGAGAVAQSGVFACDVLAAGGEREQSARRDPGLRQALRRARRRHAQR